MCEFLDECDYLIHLVRCAVHNQQPQELPHGFDFERVYQFGVHHQVANIAFYSVEKLETKPSDGLYAQWEAHRNRAVIRHINQNYAAQEVRDGLRATDVRFLEVQGTIIKQLYPHPEYRTMSDIDFIVDLENLPKAAAVLQQLGYQCEELGGVEVSGFRAPNIHMELHTDYFPKDSAYHSVMGAPFASTGVEELYIYNMLHIAKHYFWKGCGIRRVLDAYYLNQHYANMLDRKYVQSVFEAADVLDFTAELSALANRWFGQEQCAPQRSDMAVYILNSGIHGTARNRVENRLKILNKDEGRFYKLKYMGRRIFGDKQMMYATYPVLKRCIFLYPFCWLHRAFRALRPRNIKLLKNEAKAVLQEKPK